MRNNQKPSKYTEKQRQKRERKHAATLRIARKPILILLKSQLFLKCTFSGFTSFTYSTNNLRQESPISNIYVCRDREREMIVYIQIVMWRCAFRWFECRFVFILAKCFVCLHYTPVLYLIFFSCFYSFVRFVFICIVEERQTDTISRCRWFFFIGMALVIFLFAFFVR